MDGAFSHHIPGHILHHLVHLGVDAVVGEVGDADRVDAGVNLGPLPGPVITNGVVAVDEAALHPVGPRDIEREVGKDAIDIAGVECGVRRADRGLVG